MTKFNLRTLERDESGKLKTAGTNVTLRDAIGNVTSHNVPTFAVDIRREIYTAILESGTALTRAEIARSVKRKKTPWLNDAIEDLVSKGYLTRHQGLWKNGVLMYWYSIPK